MVPHSRLVTGLWADESLCKSSRHIFFIILMISECSPGVMLLKLCFANDNWKVHGVWQVWQNGRQPAHPDWKWNTKHCCVVVYLKNPASQRQPPCDFKVFFLRNNECRCLERISVLLITTVWRGGTKDAVNRKGSSGGVYPLRRWGFQVALVSIQTLFIHNRGTTKHPALNRSLAKTLFKLNTSHIAKCPW